MHDTDGFRLQTVDVARRFSTRPTSSGDYSLLVALRHCLPASLQTDCVVGLDSKRVKRVGGNICSLLYSKRALCNCQETARRNVRFPGILYESDGTNCTV